MKQLIMLSKSVIAFMISLAATSGFAWVVASACQRSSSSDDLSPDSTATTSPSTALSAKVVNAYPKLTFSSPIEYTYANDGTNRVFVVEQEGRIRVFENDANATTAGTYLDIRSKVASGGEMGLLGLAFHPDFKQNGFFYVNYPKTIRAKRW